MTGSHTCKRKDYRRYLSVCEDPVITKWKSKGGNVSGVS